VRAGNSLTHDRAEYLLDLPDRALVVLLVGRAFCADRYLAIPAWTTLDIDEWLAGHPTIRRPPGDGRLRQE
jgi:hypothetical protein